MNNNLQNNIEDAFNSMLRTDYIPLRDTQKLRRLLKYYVDYFGYLRQIVGETDQLVVGRRGTGKTTLLYRALIECINSWSSNNNSLAKPRTLAIYLDLSKCHTLSDIVPGNFEEFEHIFVSELIDSVREELFRNWPELKVVPGILEKIFSREEAERKKASTTALKKLSSIITSGIPRSEEEVGPRKIKRTDSEKIDQGTTIKAGLTQQGPNLSLNLTDSISTNSEYEIETTKLIKSRLSIADVLRVLGELREACHMNHIIVLVDEFSSLSSDLQRRFSTLLRKILGNHVGVYIKICAITDNFSLGSSIILQRDLFQLSLDLDAFVERSGSLNSAMDGLRDLTKDLITKRIVEYAGIQPEALLEDTVETWAELSRSAMGVPRTIGIALKQGFYRSLQSNRSRLRKSDVEYGIKYAAKAYQDQFLGTCSIAIPRYCESIWSTLVDRAVDERSKAEAPCSHFMVLPRNEEKLRHLNMFFLVHLITKGRTTKKEKLSRSLYVFDYGVCLENNLGYGTEKNTIRQQRFAYDNSLLEFDVYFTKSEEKKFHCPLCSSVYKESDLYVAGQLLTFCPKDRKDLEELPSDDARSDRFTEEEMKIIGAIRSSQEEDKLLARQVADDVGCYVQKVAKFGEKLERDHLIERKPAGDMGKNIYFKKGSAQQQNAVDLPD